MADPKISVIMSVYNGEAHLGAAIQSILEQTCGDFEFIIVDDGSTDRSPEICTSFTDERIKRVDNRCNLGLAPSLNAGLALARGKLIARQDADDVSHQERLRLQFECFDTDRTGRLAFVGCRCDLIDEAGRCFGDFSPPPNEEALFHKMRKRYVPLAHGSVMFDRAIVAGLGGYDERYVYAQDFDLWNRLIAGGYGFAAVPKTLYQLRRAPESGGSKAYFQSKYAELSLRQGKESDELSFARIGAEIETRRGDMETPKALYWIKLGYRALRDGRIGLAITYWANAVQESNLGQDVRFSWRSLTGRP